MKDLSHAMTQSKVQQSFRRGLATYHAQATQQAEIAQRLGDLIATYGSRRLGRVLEFGMGTGHLTQALTQRFEIQTLYVNDLVADCAAFAPEAAQFLPGPIEAQVLPNKLDLVCSASTVQWVEDIETTVATLTKALAPGGLLALSGFGSSQFQELRALASTAAAPSYVDAEDWAGLLPDHMQILHLSQSPKTEWFDSAAPLLKHLRATGVNGAASQTWTATSLRKFEAEYRQRFGTDQGLPLTYDPVWMIARKTG